MLGVCVHARREKCVREFAFLVYFCVEQKTKVMVKKVFQVVKDFLCTVDSRWGWWLFAMIIGVMSSGMTGEDGFNHGLFCAGLSSGVLAVGYVMCYKEEFKVKFSWLTFFLIPVVAMLGLFIGELLTEK